ncbi:MAG: type topoisomerase [Bryobacterales bacterium]|nr:type topoisomerase [Bryobacterales bacterium]
MPKNERTNSAYEKAPPGLIAGCPKCEDGMLRRIATRSGGSFFGCNNYDKGCHFTIPAVIAGKTLNLRSIRELCSHGSTSLLIGFHSKTGQLFNSRLRLDEALRVVFDFAGISRQGNTVLSGGRIRAQNSEAKHG